MDVVFVELEGNIIVSSRLPIQGIPMGIIGNDARCIRGGGEVLSSLYRRVRSAWCTEDDIYWACVVGDRGAGTNFCLPLAARAWILILDIKILSSSKDASWKRKMELL